MCVFGSFKERATNLLDNGYWIFWQNLQKNANFCRQIGGFFKAILELLSPAPFWQRCWIFCRWEDFSKLFWKCNVEFWGLLLWIFPKSIWTWESAVWCLMRATLFRIQTMDSKAPPCKIYFFKICIQIMYSNNAL